jgi:hypothetical protein
MTSATVVLNGHVVSTHQGGYLGWTAELTQHLVLARTCWSSSTTAGCHCRRPAPARAAGRGLAAARRDLP